MMFNIKKSPQQNRFAEDFLFISIIWRLALCCNLCLFEICCWCDVFTTE